MKPRTSSKRPALAMPRIHPPLRRCFYGPKPNQGYTGLTKNEGIGERGERIYNFAGASPQESYEVMKDGQLVFINRKLDLDGRVNLIVEEVGQKQTRVTANTRYIVNRHLDLSNPQGQTGVSNNSISFNSGGSATFSGTAPNQTTCRANGRLETELTNLAG